MIEITKEIISKTYKDILFESIINELSHSFASQYNIARTCTDEAIDMISNDQENKNIDVSFFNDEDIKIVNINVDTKDSRLSVGGELRNISEDGTAFLKLYIGKANLALSKIELKNSIYDAISHELSHAKIYFKRYENNQELNDSPSYYDNVCEIIKDADPYSYIYKYAYALYTTYYHETQSFISQSWPEFENILKENKIVGKKLNSLEFIRLFRETNVYRTFFQNLSLIDIAHSYSDFSKTLSKDLKLSGMSLTVSEIEKSLIKIEKISRKALKRAINNCYVNFIENGGEVN